MALGRARSSRHAPAAARRAVRGRRAGAVRAPRRGDRRPEGQPTSPCSSRSPTSITPGLVDREFVIERGANGARAGGPHDRLARDRRRRSAARRTSATASCAASPNGRAASTRCSLMRPRGAPTGRRWSAATAPDLGGSPRTKRRRRAASPGSASGPATGSRCCSATASSSCSLGSAPRASARSRCRSASAQQRPEVAYALADCGARVLVHEPSSPTGCRRRPRRRRWSSASPSAAALETFDALLALRLGRAGRRPRPSPRRTPR